MWGPKKTPTLGFKMDVLREYCISELSLEHDSNI